MTLLKYIIPFSILLLISNSSPFRSLSDKSNKNFQQPDKVNCYCKGHILYGKIQIVDSFPDIKAQIVDSFPDLKVKIVDVFPSKCGEWKIVTEFPDLKVQFVNSFPDIKIQFVQTFPGRTSSKLK